jgi:hypothetical protein
VIKEVTTEPRHSGAILTLGLDAIRSNYRLVAIKVAADVECAAADVYGNGAAEVAAALFGEGCRRIGFEALPGVGRGYRRTYRDDSTDVSEAHRASELQA